MIDLRDKIPYGFNNFTEPIHIMTGGSFFKKLIKHGRKFMKQIPKHIDTYNQIREKAENAYDQYQDVKEQMPDFVTQNKHVKKLTNNIEKVAEHSRQARDHADNIITAVQPLISSPQPLEGQGLKLAGKQMYGGGEGRASADQGRASADQGRASADQGRASADRADPMYELRKQLMSIEKPPTIRKNALLSRIMDECDLSPSDRKKVKDFCRCNRNMSLGDVATIPFINLPKSPSLIRKINKAKDEINQRGTGKTKPLKTVGEVVKILTPLLALL